jgi:lipopolysaccharide biosynthesis protein
MSQAEARLIALYLPQFHPVPENDEWWGPGFTEWTNVAAARARFRGHHQPQLPGELGFYDLRLPQTRDAQATLARQHGIHGFCYYHYWFSGSRLLKQPFEDVLSSKAPDFPFCLCWANESWTRAWDGLERHILRKQEYSAADNQRHIEWLLRAFHDDRYIRIDGMPVFVFYKLHDIPDVSQMLTMWRAEAKRNGLPGLYLCAMRTGFTEGADAELLANGVDAVIDFQPNGAALPLSGNLTSRLSVVARKTLPVSVCAALAKFVTTDRVLDYGKVVEFNIARSWPKDYTKFPCVFPSWDNSSRRKAATIIQNSDPRKFQQWLEAAIECVQPYAGDRRMVFINAWNEWAEGCHLEPDRKNGRAFLNATLAAVQTPG